MKTSFKKNAPATAHAEAEVEPFKENPGVDLAPPTDAEGRGALGFPAKAVDGEFLTDDFIIPKLNLVQAVGPLSEKFEPGSIVYNKELVLSGGATPISLTVLRIKKQYAENTEYGGEEMPRVFDTVEEVRSAGGWIDWRDNQRPPFSPVLHALVLIKATEAENALFPYEFEGTAYGMALWSLRSTAFTRAGKTLITASKFALKDGLHTGSWSLMSRREKLGMNFVHVPVLRHEAKNSPSFAGFAASLAG